MNILITGVTGFIGERLVKRLVGRHRIIGMSRSSFNGEAEFIAGSFDRLEDLQQLDELAVDAVIHLAAVTGGCSEEEAIAVNVQGTRRLYRYLLDRGCKKFVTASSIAAVGSLDRSFAPLQLPIPDDHPCLARDAYGLSKAMVEELTKYFHRLHPDTDFVNLRFGAVVPDETWIPPDIGAGAKLSIPFVLLSRVFASDVVEGIVRVVESPFEPRVLTANLVGPDISSTAPTKEMLLAILGTNAAGLNLSHYELPGHAYGPLYDTSLLKSAFGFAAVKSTRAAEQGL